jgi:hypothetical protein
MGVFGYNCEVCAKTCKGGCCFDTPPCDGGQCWPENSEVIISDFVYYDKIDGKYIEELDDLKSESCKSDYSIEEPEEWDIFQDIKGKYVFGYYTGYGSVKTKYGEIMLMEQTEYSEPEENIVANKIWCKKCFEGLL